MYSASQVQTVTGLFARLHAGFHAFTGFPATRLALSVVVVVALRLVLWQLFSSALFASQPKCNFQFLEKASYFAEGGFPGIYNILLTDRCWSADGKSVILSTAWRSSKVGVYEKNRFRHNFTPSI